MVWSCLSSLAGIQVAADADRATAEALARGRPPPPPPLSPTLVDKLANPEKTREDARKAVEANAKVREAIETPLRRNFFVIWGCFIIFTNGI